MHAAVRRKEAVPEHLTVSIACQKKGSQRSGSPRRPPASSAARFLPTEQLSLPGYLTKQKWLHYNMLPMQGSLLWGTAVELVV